MGKILIVGGTGLVGSAITRALGQAGAECVVFARHEPKGLPPRASFIAGDVANPDTVARAVQGCDGAVTALAGQAGTFDRIEHRGVATVVDAMARAGGRRVVMVSGSSTGDAPAWFEAGQAKRKAEARVLNGPVEGVVLRPSWFMDSLGRSVRNGSVSYFGRQPHPIHWLALDDFGAAVIRALSSSDVSGTILPVYGPEGTPFREAAASYAKAMGLTGGTRSAPLWMGRLIAAFSKDLRPVVQLMRVFETFQEDADLSQSHDLLGRPPTTLDQWLSRHSNAD